MASPQDAVAAESPENNAVALVAEELLKPGEVTPQLVAREIRRARRLGIYWRVLDPLERALLQVAARLKVDSYRSPKVRELLARLIARIELYTMRGVVVLTGLRYALSRGAFRGVLSSGLRALVEWARSKLKYILYLGRSMLVVEGYLQAFVVWAG